MAVAKTGNSERIPALDFTKGALVLIMVLYHWLNYFFGPQRNIYVYLRFLTPSFIFITGFLISNVYLSKYTSADSRLTRRLMNRGLKILALFTFLNLGLGLVISRSYNGALLLGHWSVQNAIAIYGVGYVLTVGQGKAAVFNILVPISYLLLLCAGLIGVARHSKYIFHFLCLALMICVLVLKSRGFESGNLELIAVGLLGVACGFTPIEKINKWAGHPAIFVVSYGFYVIAITAWNATFPLQIVGVCLSLMLLYLLGSNSNSSNRIRSCTILLGKYSLWGYIAQIAILQLIYRGVGHTNHGAVVLGLTFLTALALTVISVEAVDRARVRVPIVDRLYRAVFA